MGAKFKAPRDSRCVAEMEEQHFGLHLPPCVVYPLLCSISTLSFFLPSLYHCLHPDFFNPPFLWEDPSLSLAFPSTLVPLVALSPALILFQYLILLYIRFSPALLFSRSPSFYRISSFIPHASLSKLTDIDPNAAEVMPSWCKFVQKP